MSKGKQKEKLFAVEDKNRVVRLVVARNKLQAAKFVLGTDYIVSEPDSIATAEYVLFGLEVEYAEAENNAPTA